MILMILSIYSINFMTVTIIIISFDIIIIIDLIE
jgi:hypothetical protein